MICLNAILERIRPRSRRCVRQRLCRQIVPGQLLEERALLAGNVLASENQGNLFLTGDAQSNLVDIVIRNGDLVVAGRDGTTINGTTSAFVVAAGSTTLANSFFASLGRGDDVLFVEGISIRGQADVTGHAGNDRVGFRNTTVSGGLVVDTAAGADVVNLDNVTVGRNLTITSGRQNDTVRLVNSTVAGNAVINGGTHADTVVFDNVTIKGNSHTLTGAGADNVTLTDSTIDQAMSVMTGRGDDFVMLDHLTNTGRSVIRTQGQHDLVVVENASQLETLTIAAGAGQDAVQIASDTVMSSGRKLRGSDSDVVSVADRGRRLNDAASGAMTLSTAAADFFAGLATTAAALPLTLDVSSNQTFQSSGTLVTTNPSFALQVATQPGATVAIDSNGDGLFDNGTTTADSNGAATLDVTLVNNATNQGSHALKVQATNGNAVPVTDDVDVFLAEGTVVRFDTSLGNVDVVLYDQDAPKTVAAFLNDLERYDGSIIHRNVNDFIVQGGGFDVSGTTVQDVSSFPAPPNEFNVATPLNSNLRGTLSTAQNSNINSFSGEWFINTIDNDQTSPVNNLDAVPHTVFGKVIGTGMTVVDAINNTPVFNVSSLLTGSGASALTDVPLVNYTVGTVPTSANFITVNNVTRLTPLPNSGNTFSVFENSAKGTAVGTVTAAVTGSPVIYQFANTSQASQLNLNPDDHLQGPLNAPVVVVEYMSLQCPHCAEAQPVLAQLQADNPGNVLIVRRHLPLDSATGGFFDHGFEAALAAEAAGRQGKFDEMMTQLFNRQSEWTNSVTAAQAQAVFEEIAFITLGLNSTQFNADISDPALTARISRDITDAGILGATATPTFYVNGIRTAQTPTTSDVLAALQTSRPALTLDRRSGALTVFASEALDFETRPTLPVTITATGTDTSSISAVVNLIDVFAG